MTPVIIVTKDASFGSRLLTALSEIPVHVFCINDIGSLGVYVEKLDAGMAIIDSAICPTELASIAPTLSCEIVVLPSDQHSPAGAPAHRLLQGPWDDSQIRAIVRKKLRGGLPASVFDLAEYVQVACMSRRSVRVCCSNVRATGHITILAGEVWEARASSTDRKHHLTERDAFQYWVTQEWLWLRVEPAPQPTGERTIFAQWEHMLIESMQLQDEGLDIAKEWPPPSGEGQVNNALGGPVADARKTNRPTAPPPSSSGYPARARRLVNQAIRAITSGDYVNAERGFAGALELVPDDGLVEYRLRKVREFLQGRTDT